MVSNTQQWDDRILRSVAQAASRSYSAHRGFVERDDLQQEGYLWVLLNAVKVNGWLDEGKDGLRLIQHALYQHMHEYTMKQRYLKDGTKPDDYFSYQTGLIIELLPDALHHVAEYGSLSSDVNAGIRSSRLVNEGGELMAMVADVRQALAALPDEDKLLLLEKYGDGEPVPNSKLAAMYATDESKIARRIRKVIKRMASELGATPPVSRKVMSNAQSQHVTREQEQ